MARGNERGVSWPNRPSFFPELHKGFDINAVPELVGGLATGETVEFNPDPKLVGASQSLAPDLDS